MLIYERSRIEIYLLFPFTIYHYQKELRFLKDKKTNIAKLISRKYCDLKILANTPEDSPYLYNEFR
jgi:hypothetical protein